MYATMADLEIFGIGDTSIDQSSRKLTPPQRKFGTDLSRSALGNSARGSAAKGLTGGTSKSTSRSQLSPKVALDERSSRKDVAATGARRNLEQEGSLGSIVKSSPAAARLSPKKKVTKVRRSATKALASSATAKSLDRSVGSTDKSIRAISPPPELLRTVDSSASSNDRDLEYMVRFTPGPIGVRLEPVVKSMGRELGCRVVKFVDMGPDRVSQAMDKVNLCDVVVAIDGMEVMSKSYQDIISILKKAPPDEGRVITFRSVQESTTPRPRNNRKQSLLEAGVAGKSTESSRSSSTPNTSMDPSVAKPERDETPVGLYMKAKLEEERKKRLIQTGAGVGGVFPPSTEISHTTPSENVFSPSNVKKLNSLGHHSPFSTPKNSAKPIANLRLLRTVMKSVAPVASTAASTVVSSSVSVTNTMSEKLGEALVGHSSKEFEHAMRLKRELLIELSEAKAALGADEERRKCLQKTIDDLTREKASEMENAERALIQAKEVQAATEIQIMEKDDQMKAASALHASEVGRLEAQNGLLQAQAEQLKLQFGGKEREMTQRIAQSKVELEEKVNEVKSLHHQLELLRSQVDEKENELSSLSVELTKQTSLVEEIQSQLAEKEGSLQDALQREMTIQSETELEQEKVKSSFHSQIVELKETVEQAETKKASAENRLAEVQKELSEVKERAEETETKLKDSLALIGDLEQEVSRLKEQLSQKEVLLNEQTAEIGMLRDNVSNLQETNTGVLRDRSDLTEQVQTLQAHLDKSTTQWKEKELELLDQQRLATSQARSMLEQREAAHAESKKEYEKLLEAEKKNAFSLSRLHNETAAKLKEERVNAIAELDQARTSFENREKQLKHELANMQEKVKASDAELRTGVEEMECLKRKADELVQAVTRLEEEKREALAQKEATDSSIENLNEEMHRLKDTASNGQVRYREEMTELREQRDLFSSEVKRLQEEVEEGKKVIERVKADLEAVRASSATKRNDLQSEVQRMREVMKTAEIQHNNEVVALQKRSDKYSDELHQVKSRSHEVEVDASQLRDDLAKSTDFLKEKDSQINELMLSNNSLEAKLQSVEKEKDQIIATLQKKLYDATEEISGLKIEMQRAQSKIVGRDQTIASKDEEITELHRLKEELAESFPERIAESKAGLEEQMQLIDAKNARLEAENADLRVSKQAQIDELLVAVDSFEGLLQLQRSAVEKEHARVKEQNDALAKDLATKELELQKLQKRAMKDRQLLNESFVNKELTAKLRADVEDSNRRLYEALSMVDEREKAERDLRSMLTGKEEEILQLKDRIVQCEENLSSASQLKDEYIERLSQIESQGASNAEEAEKRLAGALETISTLENALRECQCDLEAAMLAKSEYEVKCLLLQDAAKAKKQLECDLEGISFELQGLATKNESLERCLEATKLSYDQATAKKADEARDLHEKIANLKASAEKREHTLAELKEESMRKSSMVESLKKEALSAHAEQEALISSLRADAVSNASEVQLLHDEVASLTNRYKELETAYEKAQAQASAAGEASEKAVSEFNAELANSALKVRTLEAEIDALTASSNSTNSSHEAKVKQLEAKCASLEGAAKEAVNRASAIEDERATLSRDLHLTATQNGELSRELDEAKAQLETLKVELENSTAANKARSLDEDKSPDTESGEFLSPALKTLHSRHSHLLDELKKMKSTLTDVMTPSKGFTPSRCSTPGTHNGDAQQAGDLNDDFEERDVLLHTMAEQLDGLVTDLSEAKRSLLEKEDLLHSLGSSMNDTEKERNQLAEKVETMETTLTHEMMARRIAEEELERQKRRENTVVSSQMDIAQEMARQLQTTKDKLVQLRSYFEHSDAMHSNESSFWEISDDEGNDISEENNIF